MDINLNIDVTTILIQITATILLCLVVARFFTKPMKEFIAKRQTFVQETFNEAEQAKVDATTTKKELDDQLSKLRADSRATLEKATKKAKLKADSILEEAKTEAEKVMRKADERNERERMVMLRKAQDQIAEITTQATETLIRKEIDEKAHDDLFDEFVKLVGGDHE